MVDGQVNLVDAIEGTIEFTAPDGREYRLGDDAATLLVRPRGWHLHRASTCWSTASRSPARCSTSGCYFFHNARALLDARQRARTSTCRRWRATSRRGCGTTCSSFAEDALGLDRGDDPGDGADRDAPGGVRDGRDPLRAARALGRAQRRALGLHLQRRSRCFRERPGVRAARPQRGDDDGARSCAPTPSCW